LRGGGKSYGSFFPVANDSHRTALDFTFISMIK
jgi:hypothetical protein